MAEINHVIYFIQLQFMLAKTNEDRTVCRNVLYTEKYFRNIIKSTRNQIVFTIFRLILIQTDVRLVPNQSENDKYNLISG